MDSSNSTDSSKDFKCKSHLFVFVVVVRHLQIAQAKGPFHLFARKTALLICMITSKKAKKYLL